MARPVILVIEDNDDNAFICQTILQHHGWEVVRAVDGVGGLRSVAELRPALVILDLSLPRLSGWEVAERLRADLITAEIPILIWSAQASEAHRTRAEALGCAAYLQKPSGALDIVQLVERILGTHSAAVTGSEALSSPRRRSDHPCDAFSGGRVTQPEPTPRPGR